MSARRAVTITGVASLRRVLRQAPADLKREVVEAVASGAALVEAEMKVRVPRDTGALGDVIRTKTTRDGMSARVGPGVRGKRDMRKAGWRARFAERGTKRHPAQPFIQPAKAAHEESIRRLIGAAIGRALTRMARGAE